MPDISLFVLRRAWLFGVCRRKDINRVLGTATSPNQVSLLMRRSVNRWSGHLVYRKGLGVFPICDAMTPEPARASAVLDLIARGAPATETGIFEHDGVPFLRPMPRPATAMSESATRVILDAALREKPVRILYVGLRRGESPRWRSIWPRAMEHTGLFWRIHAQDIGADGFPIRTYMLARVFDAEPMSEKDVPRNFVSRYSVRDVRRLRVYFSDELSKEQEMVLRNQLGVRDGIVEIPDHALHAFRQEFMREPVPSNVIWPAITRADLVE